MMSESIAVSLYLRAPRLDVPAAISLGKMLKQAQPAGLPAPARRVAKRLGDAVKALEEAFREGGKAAPTKAVDVRRCDRRLDNLWSAVRDRLAAYRALSEGEPTRTRAEGLVALLFPDGLSFLLLPYLSQHAESQKRLDLIAEGELDRELRALVGARFLDELGQAHQAYGVALGIAEALPEPAPTVSLLEPLRDVLAAVRAYTLQLVALAEADERARDLVRAALRPIDVVRTAARRRSGGGSTNEPSLPEGDDESGEPSVIERIPPTRSVPQEIRGAMRARRGVEPARVPTPTRAHRGASPARRRTQRPPATSARVTAPAPPVAPSAPAVRHPHDRARGGSFAASTDGAWASSGRQPPEGANAAP
jgi:hypothetical protein